MRFHYIASAKSGTGWRITIGMRAPKTVWVRALSADGRVLAKKKGSLDWRCLTQQPEPADATRHRTICTKFAFGGVRCISTTGARKPRSQAIFRNFRGNVV